ncbi:hypothetical protein [Smaragdicoccus niigatensis]|uniref:hypothetical protein n=1 Tax=Smaragdicoccus niigatensis TaxID=359359 RepID=UPI00039A0353|nr:hypothetical protein [Smaragdicoccus niigatensis]
MKRALLSTATLSTLAFTACSSSEAAKVEPVPTVPEKASFTSSFGNNGIFAVPLSADAKNRLTSVVLGPEGSIYAAGFTTVGKDQQFAVARVTRDGKLDTSFGDKGIATVDVSPGTTGEQARTLLPLADGKLLVLGTAEHDGAAAGDAAKDTDIVAVQFDKSGKLDAGFGTGGIARIDLGAGTAIDEKTFIGDAATGIVTRPKGGYTLLGSTLAGPGRTDADFVLIGMTDNGALDTAFGTDGVTRIDIPDTSTASTKNLIVHNDKIVGTGYAKGADGIVRPVVIRADQSGVLDTGFGTGGYAMHQVLGAVTESYWVAPQGDDYVLTGYGRDTEEQKVDMIAYRFTTKGDLDTTFGTNGVTRLDHIGEEDRGRNVAVLSDGRILIAGSGTKESKNGNAMVVLLTKDGALETTFGESGRILTDLGGVTDTWFSIALSPDESVAYLAGFKGADAEGTDHDTSFVGSLTLN